MAQHLRDISTAPRVVESDRAMSGLWRRILPPDADRGGTARLSAFYAASFLLIGVQMPFWPVWLSGRGLSAPQIALIFAMAIWARVAATPLLGALADRIGHRRALMIGLAAAACIAYALLWRYSGIWAVIVFSLIAGVAQSTLMPIGDSITLAIVRHRGTDYGRSASGARSASSWPPLPAGRR
jgi:MFS family permease